MRVLADLPEDDIKWLDRLAQHTGKSRAALLRDAIAAFRNREEKAGIDKYFGLWEKHGSTIDGLEYEQRLRNEWPDQIDGAASKDKRDVT